MLFHRRVFLRAMSVLTAAPGLRAAGWNVTQQASRKKEVRNGNQKSWHATFGQGAVRLVYGLGAHRSAYFRRPIPALVQGASVTFEPGARTAWHTHPLGQTLIVTAGCGWVQREGGPIEEIRPGDVVWFSPGEKHWHGATPTTGMTHIAIQEKKDGKVVDWMEHVSDRAIPKIMGQAKQIESRVMLLPKL